VNKATYADTLRRGGKRWDKPLEAVAHHEAGHAVIALALGFIIREVSIVAQREVVQGVPGLTLGHSSGRPPRKAYRTFIERPDGSVVLNIRGKRLSYLSIIRNQAVYTCSGPEAEYRFWIEEGLTTEKAKAEIYIGSGQDQKQLESLMKEAFGHADRAWLDRRKKKSKDLIDQHWREIKAVAMVLMKKKRLKPFTCVEVAAALKATKKRSCSTKRNTKPQKG
jgi:hypothetical protein